MSKKKNPLKDLNEFLQQQATTLAAPVPLSEPEDKKIEPASAPEAPFEEVTAEKMISDLQTLAKKQSISFRAALYDIIIRSIETQPSSSPEDKMLVNTALYLKSGNRWKEVIREYWKSR